MGNVVDAFERSAEVLPRFRVRWEEGGRSVRSERRNEGFDADVTV